MFEEFNPSWINVLDKIIMEWFNKYAPGSMFVGHKPQPFCNERHIIFCVLTSSRIQRSPSTAWEKGIQ